LDGAPSWEGCTWRIRNGTGSSSKVAAPPGLLFALLFHHTIGVRQLRATVDVHIHYSFEQESSDTAVNRWLVLDFSMPVVFRPLRRLITAEFDKENLRTMAAVKRYAEEHAGDVVPG
jgi:hypothetical protein